MLFRKAVCSCSSVVFWVVTNRSTSQHSKTSDRRLEFEALRNERASNPASTVNILKGSILAHQLFIKQIARAVPLLTTFRALTVFQQQPWDKLMRANAVSLKRLINSVLDKILHSLWHFGDSDRRKSWSRNCSWANYIIGNAVSILKWFVVFVFSESESAFNGFDRNYWNEGSNLQSLALCKWGSLDMCCQARLHIQT